MGNKSTTTSIVKRFHNIQAHEQLAEQFTQEVIHQLKDVDISGELYSDEFFKKFVSPNKDFEGRVFEPKLLIKKIVEKLQIKIAVELNSLICENDSWTIDLNVGDNDHHVPVPDQYANDCGEITGLGLINCLVNDICLFQERAVKDSTKIQRKKELINSLTSDQLEAIREFSPDLLDENTLDNEI